MKPGAYSRSRTVLLFFASSASKAPNRSLQSFVFFAGLRGHLLDGFELVAGHDVHRREQTFKLALHRRLGFAANSLRHLRCVAHEPREIFENFVLRHVLPPKLRAPNVTSA